MAPVLNYNSEMDRISKAILPCFLILAAALGVYGLFNINELVKWANANWKPAYLGYSLLVVPRKS